MAIESHEAPASLCTTGSLLFLPNQSRLASDSITIRRRITRRLQWRCQSRSSTWPSSCLSTWADFERECRRSNRNGAAHLFRCRPLSGVFEPTTRSLTPGDAADRHGIDQRIVLHRYRGGLIAVWRTTHEFPILSRCRMRWNVKVTPIEAKRRFGSFLTPPPERRSDSIPSAAVSMTLSRHRNPSGPQRREKTDPPTTKHRFTPAEKRRQAVQQRHVVLNPRELSLGP